MTCPTLNVNVCLYINPISGRPMVTVGIVAHSINLITKPSSLAITSGWTTLC